MTPTRRHFKPTEDTEQMLVCEWLRAKGIFFFSVPNEAVMKAANAKGKSRESRYGVMQKLRHMGLLPGAPDLVIVTREGAVIFLEMKRDKNCTLNDNQVQVHHDLLMRTPDVVVGYGATDAIQKLEHIGCW